MLSVVADVSDIVFDVEAALSQQLGTQPLPFPGMDKSGAAVCEFFLKNNCIRGSYCPFRHTKGEKTIVCKHWLRGLCKKGDQCEFLHEYDMSKMPECYFYTKFGECMNKECQYLHVDPESRIRDCPWYDRGFCKHGPHCRHRHVRRVLCVNYLCGFCPEGKQCKYMHPRFELPVSTDYPDIMMKKVICHRCFQPGHKISTCPLNTQPEILRPPGMVPGFHNPHFIPGPATANVQIHIRPAADGSQPMPRLPWRPLETVTCFKCGEKGHYANKCTKSKADLLKV
ncbi:cleavage and polyadenylation specificity factor subunit 4-like [Paramuricea clavata]|uniref:Cleavage and polyadenylation specificity factor subunit 4 n=1 Tax=Paramuricea clavata TaxID=317549 RepID=A0A7D9DHL4_PARCT|nr:cleavage and polyadenylation specificity factor subunit 4-like [Paramuricea clavata]